ncbi:hypothetical protein V0288_05990 [Pannus brasiliensis CCIBt3594]|uniref:Uncharacterized protein n=1 Tax=Pannus brasiliensis CCIBt3594 TaxID=1427578 RepID=A0AAW9QFY6_9CHRO
MFLIIHAANPTANGNTRSGKNFAGERGLIFQGEGVARNCFSPETLEIFNVFVPATAGGKIIDILTIPIASVVAREKNRGEDISD